MTDAQRTTIIGYAQLLNSNIPTDAADDLLVFVVNEVADRVLLYLKSAELPEEVERITAQIVVTSYNSTAAQSTSTEGEQAVGSVSDNGQTVSFTNEMKAKYIGASDNEIFGGFTELLKPYRRVRVVS